jgi:TrmH family RNA methyltransferase
MFLRTARIIYESIKLRYFGAAMSAISKTQIKFIRSLHQKKFSQMYGKFLVEGDKAVRELVHSSFNIDAIYALSGWAIDDHLLKSRVYTLSEAELSHISTHDAPNQVIAVADIPPQLEKVLLSQQLYIACDQINDPGNAGTIIRIADWFGIDTVIFSDGSVDVYNPKVVSAAKGSLFRVKVVYADLKTLFNNSRTLDILGAAMDGDSIYDIAFPHTGILLIGNEANGISDDLYTSVTKKISIPSFGDAESLNAAVATGIIVSEWKQKIKV